MKLFKCRKGICLTLAALLIFINSAVNVKAVNDNYIGVTTEYEYVSQSLETGETEYYSIPMALGLSDGGYSEGYFPQIGTQNYSIIGEDNRQHITDTSFAPWSCVAFLESTFADGSVTYGTAFMYWSDIALTAGHTVYKPSKGYATSVTIWPGRLSANNAPYGSATVKTIHISTQYKNYQSISEDYAVLELNSNIGDTVGYFGTTWKNDGYTNQTAFVSGYPGDKLKQQWIAVGTISKSDPYMLYYDIDTMPGDSGAPIIWNASYGHTVIGIHTRGVGTSTANSGVRITESLFNWFQSFRD